MERTPDQRRYKYDDARKEIRICQVRDFLLRRGEWSGEEGNSGTPRHQGEILR